MFNPDGCFCCNPPEDPCTLSGCTWSSTDMSDTDLTDGVAYHNAVSGTTPDGTYEITNVQETGTGNDAPCRKITISTTTAPHKPDTIYTICWKDNATHNPATQCPLTSVSFCVESKRHSDSDSGLSDSVVFVVRQGGKIYATATHPVGVNWKRANGVYTSGQFNWINGTGNPNFSASGTSIEFGFALKLQVGKDEDPLDVVLFDNLCITTAKSCGSGCGASVYCVFDPGTEWGTSEAYQKFALPVAVDSPVDRISASIESYNGTDGCLKVSFNGVGLNGYYGGYAGAIDTGIIINPVPDLVGNTCPSIESIEGCIEIAVDKQSENVSGSYFNVMFKQNGHYYSGNMNRTDLHVSGSSGNWVTKYLWVVRNWPLRWDGSSPYQWYWSMLFTSSGNYDANTPLFDPASPFEISVAVSQEFSQFSPSTSVFDLYLRKVCLRATLATCNPDATVTVSGVTLIPKSGTGCSPSAVASAESAINSTLILTLQASTGCSWRYSGVSGNVVYTVLLTLGGKVGSEYTTGSIRIVAGVGGNNMHADYTLSAPFNPCNESGVFDFVSAVGGANCLILSGSNPITVSLV